MSTTISQSLWEIVVFFMIVTILEDSYSDYISIYSTVSHMNYYSIVVCIIISLYSLSGVNAFEIASLDNQLMKAYMKLKEPSTQQLFATEDLVDIYDRSREALESTMVRSFVTPIQNTYDQLISDYPSCNLSMKRGDIIAILAPNRQFLSDIVSIIKRESLGYPTQTDTLTSCKKWLQCSTNILSSDIQQIQHMNCQSDISRRYASAQQIYNRQQLLAPAIIDDTMFMNGTLDDSPYDLLLDIGQISRLLFETPTDPPIVTFFAMPTLPGDGGSVTALYGSGSLFVRTTTGDADSSGGRGDSSLFSGMAYSGNGLSGNASNRLTGFAYTQTGRISTNTIGNSTTINISKKPGFIEDPVLCEVVSPANIMYNTQGSEYNTRLIQSQQKSDTQERINTFLGQGALSFGSGKDGSKDDNDGSTPETIDLIVDQGFDPYANPDNQQTKQCLARCDKYGISDKLVCQARCLCGQITSPGIGKIGDTQEFLLDPGAFVIKYCQIPATAKTVVANKQVMSIEDIIKELRNIVKNLRDGGQLLKHTQPKEHLDTSMSKIKMGQLFAFDLAVSFKQIFNQPESRQRIDNLKEEIQRTAKLIKQQSSDLAIRAERNKYLIIADPCLSPTLGSQTESLNDAISEQKTLEEMCRSRSPNITQTQRNQLQFSADTYQSLASSSALDGFVSSQARFWREMRQLLGQVLSVSTTLKQRIDQGK